MTFLRIAASILDAFLEASQRIEFFYSIIYWIDISSFYLQIIYSYLENICKRSDYVPSFVFYILKRLARFRFREKFLDFNKRITRDRPSLPFVDAADHSSSIALEQDSIIDINYHFYLWIDRRDASSQYDLLPRSKIIYEIIIFLEEIINMESINSLDFTPIDRINI